MIKADKKLKALTVVLSKENNVLKSDAIMLLREEQPFEGAIGLLTSLYDKNDDRHVRKAIEGFMNDLKDQTAGTEVMHEIRKPWKPDTIGMLVSSCWQSGLDYSAYSNDLVEVFMTGDYVTAVECFTVIEEFVHGLSREKKAYLTSIIEESQLTVTNEKKALITELLSILSM
jgi:hypothetical protein